MDVCYKSGDGHNKTAQHINTVEVNGSKLHKIQLSDGTLTNVPACHLQLLEHTDLTNIPVDVETYYKEAESGLKTQDIVALTRPQSLSLLHQELIYWHNHLYHMPNIWLIQLSKERLIPRHLSALKEKLPICASFNFGRAHKRPWQKKGKHTNII